MGFRAGCCVAGTVPNHRDVTARRQYNSDCRVLQSEDVHLEVEAARERVRSLLDSSAVTKNETASVWETWQRTSAENKLDRVLWTETMCESSKVSVGRVLCVENYDPGVLVLSFFSHNGNVPSDYSLPVNEKSCERPVATCPITSLVRSFW